MARTRKGSNGNNGRSYATDNSSLNSYQVSRNRSSYGEELALQQYWREIENYPPLSKEREVELSARIRQGDALARKELINSNLRFVVYTAKEYMDRGLSLPELVAIGNIGLITAAEKFDGTRGFKFISYAVWWIKQSILQALGDNTKTVRIPLSRRKLLREIIGKSEKLEQKLGRDPTICDIAEEIGRDESEVRQIVSEGIKQLSLDDRIYKDDDVSYLSRLRSPSLTPEEELEESDTKEQLLSILDDLPEREREIITLYYGLNGEESLTLDEIGERFHLTRERIRQIKEQALAKLRKRTIKEDFVY